MGKIRSLNSQLNYCITQNCHMGESKRQYKQQHKGKTDGRVFSIKYAENLRDTAQSIAKFMKENYFEVRMARDINEKHIQSWINYNSNNWSQRTIENKISQAYKIAEQINNTYSANITLKLNAPEVTTRDSVRNVAFSLEDYMRVREYLKNGKSQSLKALEITGRCGLRVNEVSCLKTENINLENHTIEIREGAKNGKWRDIPIRNKDMNYFRELKENNKSIYVTESNKPDSLNKGIRRALIDLGISDKYKCTTEHAIRKMYATERMEEERKKGKSENAAWSVVQQELGHGAKNRENLYRVYVK